MKNIVNPDAHKTASGKDSEEAFKERQERYKDAKPTTFKKLIEEYYAKKKQETNK